jgi:ubiquinone/menaquinone biosynthesis C-methylase UbiE
LTTQPRHVSEPLNPWAEPAFVTTYERWADPQSTKLAKVAFDKTGVEPGSRILDVGTGVGGLAVLAAERECSVVAVDSSDLMVQRTNTRLAPFGDAHAIQMNARALDLDDDDFDAAFSVFSVTLMPHRDASLREMVRVVRPGGFVCLVHWATPYGHPIFGIVLDAMEQLELSRPGAMGPPIAPLENSHLVHAGCVDVSITDIKLPATLPAPTSFLDELGPILRVIPGFSALQRIHLANLESLVAHKVTHGGPWTLEATIGVGHVPTSRGRWH